MNNISTVGDGEVVVGHRSKIAKDVQIIFQQPAKVTIGDYCTLGSGVKIVCDGGDVFIDDWTTVHDRSLILSHKGVTIGQHCWFGQHCVLDGTGGLTIKNNVRVGMYSQIWSHVAAGEQIEGCTLYGTRPVVLEDEVWLVGSCVVASGVHLERRTIALITSNITKSWGPNVVLAGSPAQPKEKLNFYKELTLDEKWVMLKDWLEAISTQHAITFSEDFNTFILNKNNQSVVFSKSTDIQELTEQHPESTICMLPSKQYIKKLTDLEETVFKSLSGNKARFLRME